jgi:MFS family permease
MSSEAGLVARLDALPDKPFTRRVIRVFAFVFLFELGDITTFSVTAPALEKDIGLSLAQVAHITSSTFAGMFVGACAAGALSRRYGRLRTTRWFLVCFSLGSGVGLSALECVDWMRVFTPQAERAAARGWPVREIATGHEAMVTAPAELAVLLLDIAADTA